MSLIMPPRILRAKCNGCGVCIQICPKDVFSQSHNPGELFVENPGDCTDCGICVLDCGPGAIILDFSNFEWDNFYVGGHA